MTRITGLATGLDVDSLVKSMVSLQQSRVDKAKQNLQTVTWKQTLYRDLMKEANEFKNKYFNVTSSSNMLSSKNLSTFKASGLSSTAGITVKPGTGSVKGTYSITVNSLAKEATVQGSKTIAFATGGTSKIPVNVTDSNNTINIEGTDITIDNKAYSTISDVASAYNDAISNDDSLKGKYVATVDSETNSIQIEKKIEIGADYKETIAVSGKDIEIELEEGSYTAEELTSKIQSALNKAIKNDNDLSNDENLKDIKVALNDDKKIVINKDNAEVGTTNYSQNITNKKQYTPQIVDGVNDTLKISIGGNTSIELKLDTTKNFTNPDGTLKTNEEIMIELSENLNDQLAQKGINNISFSNNGGKLSVTAETGEQVIITGNATSTLGLDSRFEVKGNTSTKMSDMLDAMGVTDKKVSFEINDVKFEYDFDGADANKTINEITKDIASKAGVNVNYSEVTKSFTMSSKNTGSDSTITLKDTNGNFLGALFGDGSQLDKTVEGSDAEIVMKTPNGEQTLQKNKNNFTIDGIEINLVKDPEGTPYTETFTVEGNVDEAVKNIKEVIDGYNSLITKMYTLTSEKKLSSYSPLTDEQKEEMTEKEIELWETKAKQGLLRNDTYLNKLSSALRSAVNTPVEGAGISMSDVGISFSTDYTSAPTIVLDEDKLKAALEENGDAVVSLFTQNNAEASVYTSDLTADERKDRMNNCGIFHRISDALNDALRTTRSESGNKGYLVDIAGFEGDSTNTLSKNLVKIQENIDTLLEKLTDAENKYYKQFAALETAMSKLNSQQAWLTQQFSSGS
ncbi:Flagellar hook-associated protein [Clostridium bornimense]|uniref:Flagellar hook-associated protein 2 n=1 Tax=Clostridium bornimense TaxID=1216932 RepID=W6RWU2_9CLOT|nr:flagellar filament capping protein FliD [Clostridium bornimense]CDM68833.1 Flagellar hook-associated protein [Clostridium bornimense]